MPVPPVRWNWPAWFALVGLSVVVALGSSSLPGISGAAIPFVLTIVVGAAVALALALSISDGERLHPGLALRAGYLEKRCPARECDPDAAGHVRPRAPGRS